MGQISQSRERFQNAYHRLQKNIENSQSKWDDEVAGLFAKTTIGELASPVALIIKQMDKLDQIIKQARSRVH